MISVTDIYVALYISQEHDINNIKDFLLKAHNPQHCPICAFF